MESFSKIEWEFIQEDIELINDYEISSNIGLTGVNSCIICYYLWCNAGG